MTAEANTLPAELRTVTTAGEVALVHPDTGAALILSEASDAELADWKRAVREWVARARAAESLVDDELTARMDRNAAWTITTPSGKLKAASSAPGTSYKEPEKLRYKLQGMVDEGLLTQEALDEALPVVPESIAVRPGKLGQLAKLDGPVGRAVKRARVSVPVGHRSVSLS